MMILRMIFIRLIMPDPQQDACLIQHTSNRPLFGMVVSVAYLRPAKQLEG